MWETPEVEWVINCALLWRSSHVELSLSSHWETSHYSAALSSLWTGYRVICSLLINCPQSLTRSLSLNSHLTQRGRETVVGVGSIICGWVRFNPNPVSEEICLFTTANTFHNRVMAARLFLRPLNVSAKWLDFTVVQGRTATFTGKSWTEQSGDCMKYNVQTPTEEVD